MPEQAAQQLQAWIDGFLSGYNTASEGKDFIAPSLKALPITNGSMAIVT